MKRPTCWLQGSPHTTRPRQHNYVFPRQFSYPLERDPATPQRLPSSWMHTAQARGPALGLVRHPANSIQWQPCPRSLHTLRITSGFLQSQPDRNLLPDPRFTKGGTKRPLGLGINQSTARDLAKCLGVQVGTVVLLSNVLRDGVDRLEQL